MPTILACMAESQPVMMRWFKAVRGAKRAEATNPSLKYSFRAFRLEFFNRERDENGCVTMGDLVIPTADVEKIYALHVWEETLIHGFVRLMKRLIRHADRDSYLEPGDCLTNASMSLLDAMYQYDGSNKFITYAYRAVHRGIVRALHRAKRNYPWTNRMRELYRRYQDTRRSINRPCNFEEVVAVMELEADERSALEAAMSQVFTQGELTMGSNEEGEPEHFDFADRSRLTLDPDQKEAILRAGLDDWELKVLHAFLSGHHGWQTEVAENNINPATGEPYSRRAPHLAMERIKAKILRAYERGCRNVA
jgi:DNA-directed RNA polymerase specialized sigma subunit